MTTSPRTKKAPSKEVAKGPESELPAELLAAMTEQGTGFEDTEAQDYAIPFLSIAQGQSKALKKDSANHVPGLQLGDIYDGVSGVRWEDRVRLVLVHRERFHVEWNDRQFIARHSSEMSPIGQATRDPKTNQDVLPNGNRIVNTVYAYALVEYPDGQWSPVVLSFSRASDKIYKKLMSRARRLRLPNKAPAPLFSHIYSLSTTLETGSKGDEFYNWTIVGEPEIITDSDLFAQILSLRDDVRSGQKGAAEPQEEEVI